MTLRLPLYAVLALSIPALQGCQEPTTPCVTSSANQKAEMSRELDDTRYELQMRQDELAQMLAATNKPGVIGVTPQWQTKRNTLDETITHLKVKEHDIDLQLSSLK